MILIDTALNGAVGRVLATPVSHIILPAGLLGYFSMAYISRMTRSFMMNSWARNTSPRPGSRACRNGG